MKKIALILLSFFIAFSSCKKEEETPEPYVSYASQILGTWKLVSATDNKTKAIENYPQTIDATLLTFNNKGEYSFETACNDGVGHYLVSESGGMITSDFKQTNLVCINDPAIWEDRFISGMIGAFHAQISGSSLTITADGTWSLKLIK